MAWTEPRTWAASEVETSYFFNQHVRDQLIALDTNRIHDVGYGGDTGMTRGFLYTVGYSAGETNGAGGSDTLFSGHSFVIPAGSLSQPGDAVVMYLYFADGTANEIHTAKVSIDGGTTKATILSVAADTTAYTHFGELWLRRRGTSASAALTGTFLSAATAAAVTNTSARYLVNTGTLGTFDFDEAVTVNFYGASSTASNITMLDSAFGLVLCVSGSAPA